MPTWSEILTELQVESAQGNTSPFDSVRRKYLLKLSEKLSEMSYYMPVLLLKKEGLQNYYQ